VSHHLIKGGVIAQEPTRWKETSKTGSVGYSAVSFDAN
jgi:hypothetical protein